MTELCLPMCMPVCSGYQKVKQFPRLLRCHDGMGEISITGTIEMRSIFLTPMHILLFAGERRSPPGSSARYIYSKN